MRKMMALNKYSLILTMLCCLMAISTSQVINTKVFDRFTHYDIDDWITYAPATHITSIDVGEDYVYFGTISGGILRYHIYDKEWDYPYTTSNGLRSNHIRQVVYSYTNNGPKNWQSHVIYALTDKGIDIYNPAYDYWQPAFVDQMPPHRQPDAYDVADYRKRPNFRFPNYYRPVNSELPDFFAERKYMFRPPDEILDEENRIFQFTHTRVVDFFRRLWIGTNGLGVASSNAGDLTLNIHQQSITNIAPRDSYYDADENTLWIGGHSLNRVPDGVIRWNMDKNSWHKYEAPFYTGLYNNEVNVITGNERFIFFGTEYGLTRYSKKNGGWRTFTRGEQLESDLILDLQWLGNRLFIATDEGFNWMEPPYKYVVCPRDRQLGITPVYRMAAADSVLFLATRNGVYKFNPETEQFSFFQTRSAVLDVGISTMNISKEGEIWIAGKYGVMYYSPAEDKWESFANIGHYIYGRIHDIHFTKGHVWFATDDGLLKYVKRKNHWYLYTTEDGLPTNQVFRIDSDGKDLWLSTSGGLTIFRWKKKGRIE